MKTDDFTNQYKYRIILKMNYLIYTFAILFFVACKQHANNNEDTEISGNAVEIISDLNNDVQTSETPVNSNTNNQLQIRQTYTIKNNNIAEYINANDTILGKAIGDLNKDGMDDLVVVVEMNKETDDAPRSVFVFLKQADNSYLLNCISPKAVVEKNATNVYFSDVEIKNNVLTINHDFLRGWTKHKYRLQDGYWKLIGITRLDGDASYTEEEDINLNTGRAIYDYTNDLDAGEEPAKPDTHIDKKVQIVNQPNLDTYEIFRFDITIDKDFTLNL